MSHSPHRSRDYSNNAGLLPSRPVFGGESTSKNTPSQSSLSEHLENSIGEIVTQYLTNPAQRQECVLKLFNELSKPLLGHHHHHNNRHERISIIFKTILSRSEQDVSALSLIQDIKISTLLTKWLKGESIPHGYSSGSTKKAIQIMLPNYIHRAWSQQHNPWPLSLITSFLFDVTYCEVGFVLLCFVKYIVFDLSMIIRAVIQSPTDSLCKFPMSIMTTSTQSKTSWNDHPDCTSLTRIIRSSLCDYLVLKRRPHRLQLAKPFVALLKSGELPRECLFRYEATKKDPPHCFRLAMELCCFKAVRNDIYNNMERWFSLPSIQNPHHIQFVDSIFQTLQPMAFNDDNLFADKLLPASRHWTSCKVVLSKNLSLLFEAYPVYYEMAINFVLNVKPSERMQYQLLLDCIVEATPSKQLDLSQARRKRKKSAQITDGWKDSFAVTDEEDEEEDDDDDDEMKGNNRNEFGTPLKMHHPSYILGAKMAAAREVHSHRKMCDDALKKFIAVKKLSRLDLCLFCESYLEHIAEQSTTKVKKNGLTYLYAMAKNLIRAQFLMYRECKRGMEELFAWKMEMMYAHTRITQSFVPLVQHFGFDHVIGLLFNFLLLSLFQSTDTESASKLSAVKVVSFDEVVTVNEQQGRSSVLRKPHWQSMPVAMTTLDTLFNCNVPTIALEKDQIARYLAFIRLLMERALKFVHEHKDKKMGRSLYALYTQTMTTPFAVPRGTVTIIPLLRKSMGLSRYFAPSTLDIAASLKTKKAADHKLSEDDFKMIKKNMARLAHSDLMMEILMVFTLMSCMSPHQFIDDLVTFPTTSRMVEMIILREWEMDQIPPAQKPLDIQYETEQEMVQRFCLHFVAAENTKNDKSNQSINSNVESSTGAGFAASSVTTSPTKMGGGRRPIGYLKKAMIPNLTILCLEDRLWSVPDRIVSTLKHFEAQFDISRHLWRRYLNSKLMADILKKYDYDKIVPSFLHHAARDLSLIQSLNLKDPLLIVEAIFHIVEHQRSDHWRCLMVLIKRLRVLFGGDNVNNNGDQHKTEAVQLRVIENVLEHILAFHEKVVRNGRHSASDLLDLPHLVISAILQKAVPFIDYDAMRIHLCSTRDFVNPCKWLFEVKRHSAYPINNEASSCLVHALDCVSSLLTQQKYTAFHLTAYIHFCANLTAAESVDAIAISTNPISQTLYKLVVILCESLLSYPMAFADLLQKNNINADIQKVVRFAMNHAQTLVAGLVTAATSSSSTSSSGNDQDAASNELKIKGSSYTLLTLKSADKKAFKCPLNVVVAMLYIVAYCNESKDAISSSWLSFIVSKQLNMHIVMDAVTLKVLQQHLPEQLRWKLLLKYDSLQLYCFMFRISTMKSMCAILPFLIDHDFESDPVSLGNDDTTMTQNHNTSKAASRPTAAVQLISWICNELTKCNGRFGGNECKLLFDRTLKPVIDGKANEGITIWKKIRMQCPKLFDDPLTLERNENKSKNGSSSLNQVHQCPMMMALFGGGVETKNANSSSGGGDEMKVDDEQIDDKKEVDLKTHLVDTFKGKQSMNMEGWSRVIGALFAINSDEERGDAVYNAFVELLNEEAQREDVQCLINLVVDHREYLDRLWDHTTERVQNELRLKLKVFMQRHDLVLSADSNTKIEDETLDNPLCDWLTDLDALCHSEVNSKSIATNPRKRKWSLVVGREDAANLKERKLDHLDILPFLGGFGCDLMEKTMHKTTDDAVRFKVLSHLKNNDNINGDDTLPVSEWMKRAQSPEDLHNLFAFGRVTDEVAMELILKEMESQTALMNDSKTATEEPPKKKARKFKLVLKRSGKSPRGPPPPSTLSTVKALQQKSWQRVYAEFVSSKLMDNPSLFRIVYSVGGNVKGLQFIEECIESMCSHFYSPIRGEFVVKQMISILDRYPAVMINVIHVLAKHVEEMVDHQETGSLAQYLLSNREDWYFHHFAMLLCGAKVENAYSLKHQVVEQLIESMMVFLKHSPTQFTHLNNASVYLTTSLLLKLSKHFFHFFPEEASSLENKFASTKTAKMWNVMQSIDRLQIKSQK